MNVIKEERWERERLTIFRDFDKARVNLKKIEESRELLNTLCQLWEGGPYSVAMRPSWYPTVELSFQLKKHESLKKSTLPLLGALLLETDEVTQTENPEMQYISWKFTLPSGLIVETSFWYWDSVSCKRVETGESRPVYKTVCED